MKKNELLNWLQEENRQWQAFLDQIGLARMDQPGVNGDWSIKDIIAHLAGWNRRLVAQLQAAHHREPKPAPPWPAQLQTDDEINAWIFQSNCRRPVDEVLEESDLLLQQLFALIEALPEDCQIEAEGHLVWVDDRRFPAGEFFDHFHDDHEPDMRAWLARVEEE